MERLRKGDSGFAHADGRVLAGAAQVQDIIAADDVLLAFGFSGANNSGAQP